MNIDPKDSVASYVDNSKDLYHSNSQQDNRKLKGSSVVGIPAIHLGDDDSSDEEKEEMIKKTCYHKVFAPIVKGGMRSTILSLIAGSIGSGVLGLPYICKEAGFVLGLVMIFSGGFASLWSMYLLNKLFFQFKINSYSALIRHTLGSFTGYIFDVLFVIYGIGSIVSLQVNVQLIADYFFPANKNFIWFRSLVLCGSTFVMAFPTFLREIQSLRYLSLIVLFIILYTVTVVVVQTPYYASSPEIDPQYDMVIINWKTITVMGTALYSYICQMVVIPVMSEFINPTEKRCKKSFNRAIAIEIFIYILLAGTGYISFGRNTPATVTQRPVLFSGDYAMKVAEVSLFVTLSMGIPIRANACRRVMIASFESLGLKENIVVYVLCTLFMLVVPTIISIFFEEIQAIFSILGGSLGTMIMVLWPGLMYLKGQIILRRNAREKAPNQPSGGALPSKKKKKRRYGKEPDSGFKIAFNVLYGIFNLVLGWSSATFTLINTINGSK